MEWYLKRKMMENEALPNLQTIFKTSALRILIIDFIDYYTGYINYKMDYISHD
jgi:hypothetical protein